MAEDGECGVPIEHFGRPVSAVLSSASGSEILLMLLFLSVLVG